MSMIDEKLRQFVGRDRVSEEVSPYFREPVMDTKLKVVFPETVGDVQSIVKLAKDLNMPLFTTSNTYFPPSISQKEGILIDFKGMNRIEKIDVKNLAVHIQRGVTFEQLDEELKRYNTKLASPAAATSHLPVEQYARRIVSLRGARYPETVGPTNMLVVLSDGRVQKTGSHALSEEAVDLPIDTGPYLSLWYIGAEDKLGVIVRTTIWIFPQWEERRILAFGFDSSLEAQELIRELPRRELCIEAIALNRKGFADLLGKEDGFSPWIAVIGLEGRKKLVDYQEKKILERVGKKALEISGLEGLLDRPWYVIDYPNLGFYTTFNRISEFDRVVEDAIKTEGYSMEDVGRKLICNSFGGAVFCEYDFPSETKGWGLVEKVGVKLVEKDAFFDCPQGKIAEATYSRMPDNRDHIRKIKRMMDPQNILNP